MNANGIFPATRLIALSAFILIMALLPSCSDSSEEIPPTYTPLASTPIPTATPTLTPIPTLAPTPPPTHTPAPTPTFAPEPVVLPTVLPTIEIGTVNRSIQNDLERRLDAIELTTVAIRGLPLGEPVERNIVTHEELRAIIQDEIAEDAEDVAMDDRLFTLLYILSPEDDLAEIISAAYAGVVIGMYDPQEDALFVSSDSEALTLQSEVTMAHEITHALQQRHFDIHSMHESVEDNSDRLHALSALAEGDASISDYLYTVGVFTEREMMAMAEESANVDFSGFYAAPPFLRRLISFPYNEGAQFAAELYVQNDDFSAVNAAFHEPPNSTEQVIHPEKYGVDEPVEVSIADLAPILSDTTGDEWTEVDRSVFGELQFRALLGREDGGGGNTAAVAAAGWGGDEYSLLYSAATGDALVSVSVWDTPKDADEFWEAIRDYYDHNAPGAEWTEQTDNGAQIFRMAADDRAAEFRSIVPDGVQIVVADTVETIDLIVNAMSEAEEQR